MKNKKVLIISIIIIVVLLLIACGVGGFLYYQNMKKKAEEFEIAGKKYERIQKFSEQVNDAINEEVTKTKDFLATNPDVGEDKSSIDELSNAVTELEKLKIEIPTRPETTEELNASIEKMKNQINQVDEELLNNYDVESNKNTPSEENSNSNKTSTEENTTVNKTSTGENATANETSAKENATANETSAKENATTNETSAEENATANEASAKENATANEASAKENATANETSTDKNTTGANTTIENTTSENTTQEKIEIKFSENSNFSIHIANIKVLTKKVNDAVKAEANRKAEEEKKAQEKAKKQEYVGTYKNNSGKTLTISLDENGDLYYKNYSETYKININRKKKDGTIIIFDNEDETSQYANHQIFLCPPGIKISLYDLHTNAPKDTDSTKLRVVTYGSDVPDITYNVYYKVN